MSKRNNISYIKPQDPSFLAKLKAQIGYKEGPTVETKRQKLEEDHEDSNSDSEHQRAEREDEKPQIVVLQSGDLTAEEAAAETKRIAREEAEKPADLNQPIVFKKRQQSNKETDKEKLEKTKSIKKDKKKKIK